jgi:hypothetical protein
MDAPQVNHKRLELLAEVLLLCPRGQENNTFFNCLFLNKLPRELCILLSEEDMPDKQALGARRQHVRRYIHRQLGSMFWCADGRPLSKKNDRGIQFTSAVWTSTCMQWGIMLVLTTAYHPQGTGW